MDLKNRGHMIQKTMIQTSPAELESLNGLVERVTYHNPENGYCVLRVKVRGLRETQAVVGYTSSISVGESIQAMGEWSSNRHYGPQFKAQFLKIVSPTTEEGIEKYLGSGMIKGIGPTYAKKLVQAFKTDVFDVIEGSPEKLETIEGIGPYRASLIVKGWADQKMIRDIMIFLHQYGISTSRAVRIYKTLGNAAIQMITENPYRLAREIRGIGFLSADKIAEQVGITKDSLIRCQAGLNHVLFEALNKGHCYLPKSELLDQGQELLSVERDILEEALKTEVLSGELIEEMCQETWGIFLKGIYVAEKNTAFLLKELNRSSPSWGEIDMELALPWVEERLKITLSSSQKDALKIAVKSKTVVITGGPGVGKTTLVKSLLEILRAKKLKILLCAPTGRAAKRLTESTGLEAKTLHRLLEANPASGVFKKCAEDPLVCDILVIDETSMVDISLMHSVLKAIPQKAALILIGDVDQLPSVGPGRVLYDVIQSQSLPVVKLTEIFRQASGSHIIITAHTVNRGKMPDIPQKEDLSDFYFIEVNTPEECVSTLVETVSRYIPKKWRYDPFTEIQVLSPMNRGGVGTRALNSELQNVLNPPQHIKVERFGWTYQINDKVMQNSNNYNKDVYNGDIGFVKGINLETKEMIIRFDMKEVLYEFDELDEVVLAYATTIHKAQGSEYPVVVIPLMMQHYPMLKRNLLYTGITRGKNLVVLIGQKKALAMAIKDSNTKARYTKLGEWLS